MSDFTVKEFSEFQKRYKRVLKKYERSFDDDFEKAIQTIVGKFDYLRPSQYRSLPRTKRISGLGEKIKLPVLKMKIRIEEAGQYNGRLVYIFDKENKVIFLTDVYYKQDQTNHSVPRIRLAYKEYCEEHLDKWPS